MRTKLAKINQILPLLATMLVLLGAATKVQAAARTASVSGNWSSTATWGGSAAPVAGDTVTINTGINVTNDASQACASIQINGTGSLYVNNTLALTGNIVVGSSGIATLTIASTGTMTVGGNLTVGASSGASTLTIASGGSISITGTYGYGGSGTSSITVNGTFSCAGGAAFSTGTFNNNGTATFTGTAQEFNGTYTLTQGANATLNMSGNSATTPFGGTPTTSFSASGNTVIYASGSNMRGGTYFNLTVTGNSPSAGASTIVNGTLKISLNSGQQVNSANNITMGANSTILRILGTLNGTPTFPGSPNYVSVIYANTTAMTTGSELPTNIKNLTLTNTYSATSANKVTLNTSTTVNGTFAATYLGTPAAGAGDTVLTAASGKTLTFSGSNPVTLTFPGTQLASSASYTVVSGGSTFVSGNPNGTLTVNGAGAPAGTPSVAVTSGTLVLTIGASGGPTPTITGAAMTAAFTTTYGTASTAQTFNISGANMAAGITVTPPAGFEVSQTSTTTGFAGSGTAITVGAAGTIASTPIYIRLAATAAVSGTYNSVNAVVLSSSGATSQNITTPSSGSSVSKVTPTVTVTVGSYTYTGSAQGPNTVTFSPAGDTGAVTWSYVGTGSTTYGPSSTQPTIVGTYTATAAVAADSNNNSASSSTTAFTITMATPTVTVNVGSYVYNGSPQGPNTVTISTTNTGAVTWSYVGTGVTSYGPSSTQPTALGTYTATATVAADSNNNSASSSATAFNIVTATPTAYTFNVTSGAWNNSANWTPTGIPGQSSGDTATIPTGDTVTGLGGTTVSITNLNIGGTGILNIDSSSTLNVSGTFTMGNASSGTCILTNNGTLNLTGTGNIFVMAAGSASGAVLTNTADSTFTCAGGCQSGNANNNWTFGNNGTATFTGATSPFNTGFHPAAVVNGPNGVLNLNNSVAAFGNSGTLTATAVGNTVNYGFAGAQSVATQTGTATYYNLTLSASGAKSGNATVNGTLSLQGTATYSGSATYGAGATLEYKGSSAQTTTASEFPSSSGPANLTINNSAGVTFGASRTISGTLALTAGILNLNGNTLSAGAVTHTTGSILLTPTVTLNNKVYDGTTTATTILTRLLAGTLTGDSGNVSLGTSGTVAAFSSANMGSYTPSVTGMALSGSSSANYSLSTTSVSPGANITKATASVTITPYSVTYDGSAHTATAGTVTGVNGETGATVGSVTLNTTHTNAGTYGSDAWSFTGTANYNDINATTITNTINPMAASVTADAKTKTYGDVNPALTAVTNGAVNGDIINVTLATDATQFSSVGVSNITVTAGSNPNYTVLTTNSTLTIGAKAASVTADAKAKTYGDANPTLTAVVLDEVAGGDAVSYSLATDATQFSGVGVSNITVMAGSNPNYTVLTTNSTLTIGMRHITVTAQTNTKDYDSTTSATNVPTLTSGTLASGDGFATLSEVYVDATVGTGKTLIPSATVTNSAGADVTADYAITFVNDTTGVINSSCTAPTIVGGIDPTNLTVAVGSPVILTLTNVTGSSPFAYQWFSNTVVIADATNSSYTNLSVTVADAGNYQVVVTNDCGSVTSSIALLMVNPQTPLISTEPTAATNITYGQLLSAAGLTGGSVTNAAGAIILGSFAYTTPSAVPNAGMALQSVTFTPNDTNNYNNFLISVSVTVNQSSTFVGASSTNNPSGYTDKVAYVATLPADASGSVVFLSPGGAFSTNSPVSATNLSLSITNLPRGTNLITVIYSGDSNYLGSTNTVDQIVTNHPPVAGDATYYRAKGISLKIIITNLLTNVTDADGDTITLVGVGSGTNSATITTNSNCIFYTPTTGAGSNYNDSFSYTVSDGYGGSATGNISVLVYSAAGPAEMGLPTNGVVNIKFYGIPTFSYVVETTTNLSVAWWPLSTNTAGGDGTWQFTDPNATNNQQYYRSTQP